MKRHASAVWNGTVKEGKGTLTTQTGTLSNTPYSFQSRFEEGTGTNPEELIAAAHAGCFSMQLSAFITEEGFTPDKIETNCVVDFQNGSIVSSKLAVNATIPGIGESKFQELVTKAEKNCPISKLLNTEISSEATLNG